MPSRAEASRINGAKSRGPKTEQGRRAASLNAVKHGLTADTVVLPCESEEEYEAELRDYLDHFDPPNKPEADLVRQLAAAHWRLARYTGIEANLLDLEMANQRDRIDKEWPNLDERSRLALAFQALSGAHSPLALLNRYQARLHHEYQRILKSLLQMQARRSAGEARLRNEPEPPSIERSKEPANQPTKEPSNPGANEPTNSFGIRTTAQPGEGPVDLFCQHDPRVRSDHRRRLPGMKESPVAV